MVYILEPSQGVRSFDRTFILTPAPAGSRYVLSYSIVFALFILSPARG